MSVQIELTVNGRYHSLGVEPNRTLVDVLRDEIGLTGTKKGCGEGKCGSRTVLIEGLPVAYLHVFPFSPRPGTVAFDFPQGVRGDEIRRRCMILRELGRRKREAFYKRFLHQKVRVVEEKTTIDEEGWRKGVSRNYIPVWIEPEGRHSPAEIEVEITEVRGPKVLGRRI